MVNFNILTVVITIIDVIVVVKNVFKVKLFIFFHLAQTILRGKD